MGIETVQFILVFLGGIVAGLFWTAFLRWATGK